MKTFLSLSLIALTAVSLSLAGCSGEAEVKTEGDTTTMSTEVSTPPVDTSNTTVTSEVGSEAVEKMVETQLVAKTGFAGVTVESKPGGVIVLNGTVATEAEKADAEAETKKVAGVTAVENNLTIQ